MKYEKVVIYRDSDGKFIKANVETEVGSIEVTNDKKFNSLIAEFANQEGVDVSSLLKNKSLVKNIVNEEKIVDQKANNTSDLTDEEYDEIVFGVDKKAKKTKTTKTKNNNGVVKKLVIGTSVVVVLGTGLWHLKKHTNIFDGVVAWVKGNLKHLESNYTGNKTVTVVDTGKKSDSEYDKTMEGVINRQEQTNTVISQLDDNKNVDLTQEQILTALNDNARIANSSIFEVSQYINKKDLTGKAYYYNFENNFSYGSDDYNAVKIFSDMRNDIIKSAFNKEDISTVKSKIRDFYSLYTEVVTLNGSCVNKNVVLNFNELSDMAQATILELGTAVLTINLDYQYNSNNGKLNKGDILKDTVSTLEGELIPQLINKGNRK